MRERYGAQIDWLAFEMHPELPQPKKPEMRPPLVPPVPSRAGLAFAAEGLDYVRPAVGLVSCNPAFQAVEYAKQFGAVDGLVERIYFAYWQQGQDISQTETLRRLAAGLIDDLDGLEAAIVEKRFADKIVPFDKPAHQAGVWHLPTFWIGNERYSEQPWRVLERAITSHTGVDFEAAEVYRSLDFPIAGAPKDRPYVFVNMVTTIDGKIITGERGQDVQDLGSKVDHATMRTIEMAADAVIIGAGSQRSSAKITYPSHLLRFVVTKSGNLLYDSRFFNDDREKAIVVCSEKAVVQDGIRTLRVGESEVDLRSAFSAIREEFGVQRLLVEGGSELNAQVLALELVDELFLTVAPKIKLGKDTPTYADGEPLSRENIQVYQLIQSKSVGDEVFMRYRRKVR